MTATGAAMFLLLAAFTLGLTALVLSARPRRDAHVLVAALIGTNGVYAIYTALREAGSLTGLSDELHGAVALLLNLPVFAAFIALPLVFPRERLRGRGLAALRVGAVAFVLGNAALVGLLFLLGGDAALLGVNGFGHPIFGPTAWIPFLLGASVGTVLLLDAYLDARDPVVRTQVALVLAAFALKVSAHWAGTNNFDTSGAPLGSLPWWTAPALEAGLFFAMVAVAVALPASRWRARRAGAAPPRPLGEDVLVLGAIAAAIFLGFLRLPGEVEYMVLRPLLLTYGILHFELIPVDVERRRPLVAATVFAGLGGIFLVITTMFSTWDITPDARAGLAFLGAAALGGTLAWPLLRITVAPLAALSAERSRDLYRAALAQAVGDGTGNTASNDRVLRALRERLRISEREHAELLAEAEASAGRQGELAPGRTFLGRYEVEAPLGEGGFARAFLARDERLGRRVVLKVAHLTRPEDRKRALREGRLLATLSHPNIVAVHDIEEVAGEVILVLEHVPGGSVADLLKRGKVPASQALRIADDVLAGLEAAHARGMVHRDVKPSNVLLGGDSRAKLADFGIAAAPSVAMTVSGTFTREGAGTLRYMAPEQARGLEADARSDVYAVGVLLYEMLAGRPYLALDGLADFEVRRAILEQRPALPMRGAPRHVNEALRRALAKDPSERPADAAALRRLLRGAG